MLMAELEEKEHGDEGRAREWMTRALRAKRDPAWTADGYVSDRWMPVSPVTGRLDAFQWKDPIAELDADEAVIEHDRGLRAPASSSMRRRITTGGRCEDIRGETDRVRRRPRRWWSRLPRAASRRTAPAAAPIVPLIHVPDDPGPDPQPQLERAYRSVAAVFGRWLAQAARAVQVAMAVSGPRRLSHISD